MFEKDVFEKLKTTRDRAFRAFKFAQEDKNRSGNALRDKREDLNAAWAKLEQAKNQMNREYDLANQIASSVERDWNLYRDQQNQLSGEISYAKSKQEELHNSSRELVQKSRDAYNFGDKSMAPHYSEQAKAAREERNWWSKEVRRLIDLSKSTPKPSSKANWNSFNQAKSDYYEAKKRHAKIKQDYDELKENHQKNVNNLNICRDNFNQAKKAVDDYRIAGQQESKRIKDENDKRWAELEKIAKDAEEKHVENGRRIQYEDNYAKVRIKSGFDKWRHCIVTDILVLDKTSNEGRRLHILIDENGKEIHRHEKRK